MTWYFVEGGRSVGPVAEEDFRQLVGQGRVTAATLVWREGMPVWQQYQQVLAALVGQQAPAGEAFCCQCGRLLSTDDLVRYESVWVCPDCKERFFQRIAEGLTPAGVIGAVHYAGFWIRFLAVLIDGVILWVVQVITGLLLVPLASGAAGPPEDRLSTLIGFQIVSTVLNLAIAVGYETFFIGRYAATPGKMAAGIRVIVSDGSKVSYLRAFGRYFAKQLSALTLMIGYIMAGFDREKRALHDHICNTRVVHKR